jgi:DNA-binding transcriptional LysR family regulator
MSHPIRALEERLGVRLLSRTTRSVAPTEAGKQLLSRVRPALEEIRTGLEQISGFRDKPAGRVRLLVPRLAVSVLAPKLGRLARAYRRFSWMSPPTIAVWISWRAGSTPEFTSGNTSKRT